MQESADGTRVMPTVESFELVGAGGRPIRGEACITAGATASVVLVHGFKGFLRFGFFPYLTGRLLEQGLNVVSFNFSGSGVGEDLETFTDVSAFEENTFGRELYDLVIVNREAEERGWLGEKHGLLGHSRGGGIAILHASRDDRVNALVTWSAISTVKRWTEPEMVAWRDRGYSEVTNSRTGQVFRVGTGLLNEVERHADSRLDIEKAASRVRCPWLLVHGENDKTIPVREGERLFEASRERAEFLRIPNASHVFNIAHGMTSPSPELAIAVDRTVAFFAEMLLP
ncbi:MAG: alpha/beta fold hydrolase [bacterium]